MNESKPWYKSKGVLLGLTTVFVFGGNALYGFLTPEITPEQFDAIANAEPVVKDIVQRLQNGESWMNLIGTISGVLFSVLRAWFITTPRLSAK